MASKKTFKDIETMPTAAAFMSFPDFLGQIQGQTQQDQPERKSKRLNLLLKPSLFEDLRKIAQLQRTSVNDLINTVLEAYRGEHTEDIEKYKAVFESEGNKQ